MAKWEFVEWLLFWLRETSHYEFEWDSANRQKNMSKHGISTEEVEAVFRSGLALPLGIQISPPASDTVKRYKDSRKHPTSVALDETTIHELKAVAENKGIPYQVLIRIFILNGLERIRKAV